MSIDTHADNVHLYPYISSSTPSPLLKVDQVTDSSTLEENKWTETHGGFPLSTFPFHSTLYYGPLDFNIVPKKRLMLWLIYNFPDIKKLVNEICCRQYFSLQHPFASFFFFCSRSEHNILRWFAFLLYGLWQGLCGAGLYSLAESLLAYFSTAFCPPWPTRHSGRSTTYIWLPPFI